MTRATLRADAIAGMSVALVVVPQSLAYAQLAGLPPYYGLYASLLPTIVGALLGSSAQLSTGPVALTSLLTAASIAPFAATGTPSYIECAIALALLSGVLQVAFGALRLGVLLNLLSHPVLMGFINAAAILISLSQIPAMLGIPPPRMGHVALDAIHAALATDRIHGLSAAFGAGALAALFALRRWMPSLPGVLIVAVGATALSAIIDFAGRGGQVVGEIPRGLPTFAWPVSEVSLWISLMPAAFVIALISFMEAMSSAKIASIKTATRWDENQELIGQGLAKVAAAACQTMPVSGSFSRSALNLAAGARTAFSSVIGAAIVFVTLLYLTPHLRPMPDPVLAAIIVMAVANLLNFGALRSAWKASRDDAIAAGLTFVATLVFAPNIQNGIFAGILVSLALFIFRRMRPRIEVLEPGSASLEEALGSDATPTIRKGLAIVRFDASLVFVNAGFFDAALRDLEASCPDLKWILCNGQGINSIDASGVEVLRELSGGLGRKGIQIVYCGLKPQVLATLGRTGLAPAANAGAPYSDERSAVRALAAHEHAPADSR